MKLDEVEPLDAEVPEAAVDEGLHVRSGKSRGGVGIEPAAELGGADHVAATAGSRLELDFATCLPMARHPRQPNARIDGLEVVVSHSRGVVSPTIRREMRSRNSVEPVLGHMKADGLLERNRLLGPEGDAVNAIFCAVGHNCWLLLDRLRRLFAGLIASLLHRDVAGLYVLANTRRPVAGAAQPAA